MLVHRTQFSMVVIRLSSHGFYFFYYFSFALRGSHCLFLFFTHGQRRINDTITCKKSRTWRKDTTKKATRRKICSYDFWWTSFSHMLLIRSFSSDVCFFFAKTILIVAFQLKCKLSWCFFLFLYIFCLLFTAERVQIHVYCMHSYRFRTVRYCRVDWCSRIKLIN